MAKISVLDKNTINQIAAGEVVERPSSVVKELVENAIDAGANAITAEIKEGGISFIRITDNGCGIEKEDVSVAFLRHSTSKIQTVEDLLTASSLGFRGEALSSIASISQVELVTKTRAAFTGTRYLINGGEEEGCFEIGCPEGTTFIIRNLFYNTPARRKFLKSAVTEAGYISDYMERLAVSHPEVSFKFINNNKTILHTSGNRNLKDVIYYIYGKEITAQLLEVQECNEEITIDGYIGKPEISRGNRNYENYYINGRYIKSSIISKAIEEAYKPYSMQHKYPFTALHLTIDQSMIDVNVHPTKLEIRFLHGDLVYQTVFNAVKAALSEKTLIPNVTLSQEKKSESNIYEKIPEPFETKRFEEHLKKIDKSLGIKNHKPILNTYSSNLENLKDGKSREEIKSEVQQIREQAIYGFSESNFLEPLANDSTGDLKLKDSDLKVIYDESSKDDKILKEKKGFKQEELKDKESLKQKEDLKDREKKESLKQDEEKKDSKFQINDSKKENKTEDTNIEDIKTEDIKIAHTKTTELINSKEQNQNQYIVQQSLFAEENTKKNGEQIEQIKQTEQSKQTKTAFLQKNTMKRHYIIGQLFSTYWLVEFEQQLFIIDQHAAHEKILYEKTMKRLSNKEYLSQMISPPIVISFSIREEEAVLKHKQVLEKLGFVIEVFGGREYCISAVPADMFGIEGRELLLEFIDHLVEETPIGTPDSILEKVASMSCKAAVKGNKRMSLLEAQALIDELMLLENPFHCPHGRPIIIAMTKQEIEKKFKRIL